MSVPEQQEQVVVVGAGPVGLVAAVAARARGLDVLVIEAEPEGRPRPGSKAIVIAPPTLWRLEEIQQGLGERIGAAGIGFQGYDAFHRGRRIFGMQFPKAHPMAGGSVLPQVETERILYAEAISLGVRFRWDSPVGAVVTDGAGATLTFCDGDSVRASYVIACDGAASAIRKSLRIPMEGHSDETPFIIVDVKEHPDGSTSGLNTHFGYASPELDGRNIMWMPFAGGMRVDLQCQPGDDAEWLASPEGVKEWMPRVLDPWYADNVQWISTYRFHQLVAENYTDEHRRVILAGEAAHLFAPFGGGRGLNSGVADAADAADAIAAALEAEPDVARKTIEACAEDRRAAGQWNRDCAATALKVMRADDPLTWLVREGAARISPVMPLAGAWLASVPPVGKARFRPGTTSIF